LGSPRSDRGDDFDTGKLASHHANRFNCKEGKHAPRDLPSSILSPSKTRCTAPSPIPHLCSAPLAVSSSLSNSLCLGFFSVYPLRNCWNSVGKKPCAFTTFTPFGKYDSQLRQKHGNILIPRMRSSNFPYIIVQYPVVPVSQTHSLYVRLLVLLQTSKINTTKPSKYSTTPKTKMKTNKPQIPYTHPHIQKHPHPQTHPHTYMYAQLMSSWTMLYSIGAVLYDCLLGMFSNSGDKLFLYVCPTDPRGGGTGTSS